MPGAVLLGSTLGSTLGCVVGVNAGLCCWGQRWAVYYWGQCWGWPAHHPFVLQKRGGLRIHCGGSGKCSGTQPALLGTSFHDCVQLA